MAREDRSQATGALAGFDDHARAIARRQYFQAGDATLEDMFARVASWVASPEPESSQADMAERFYDLMIERRFCPGGRVLAGAATGHGNVLNCFVQDGSPEEAGTTDWVLRLATKLALVTKVGGGNGLNLDPIRPRRAYEGRCGRLFLTIDPSHDDYEKVRGGTFFDLVRGEYVTRGYRSATFVERRDAPSGAQLRAIGDSVESIWGGGSAMIQSLLRGEDVLLDLSDLRPEGTPVKGSGGSSSGPSSFAVEVFDNFAVWASLGGAEHAGPVATLRYVFAPTLRVIRQGGCLHPDTLVSTSRGTLRLSELVDSFQYGWQEHHLKVATDEGWKESPRGFNNGNAPTLKVTLGNGQILQGTPSHRVKVMRSSGERAWVRLEDLEDGDSVIQVLDQHTGAPVLLRSVPVPHGNAEAVQALEVLNERLAFFLGYLWGDGFISQDRIGLSAAHGSPMMTEAPRLFRELFGLEARLDQKEDDASAVFVVRSAHLAAWLAANGLTKGEARQLELPRAVRSAPRPVLGAFLRGLFEADGTLIHGYPTLSTASERLAQDVAVLLAGLGIPSTQRGAAPRPDRLSRHGVHRVRVVSAKGLERFVERVGFVAGSRLEAATQFQPDLSKESAWVLPHAPALLEAVHAALPAGAKGRPSPYTQTRKALARYMRGDRNLTVTGYERLRERAGVADLLPELSYDENYVPVRSVADGGRALTLDLSVDENETYLAGGFVTHNTRRGAGMATMSITHPDIRDFITAKDLDREQAEGDISTFNISVLVSDAFMETSIAREGGDVLEEIARHAWQTGEPGLIFLDRINEFNPMREALGDIKSTNPCITADTWVHTHMGARRVRDLVGRDFCAVVDGKRYGLESLGFFPTGVKPVLKVRTRRGYELRLTADHPLRKVTRLARQHVDSAWAPAGELAVGDLVALADQREAPLWAGPGSEFEGWALGMLVGDGTFLTDKPGMAALDFWGEDAAARVEASAAQLRRLGHPLAKLWVTHGEGRSRVASQALGEVAARFGVERGAKTVTDAVEGAGGAFTVGFLRGLFDADGSVQGSQAKGISVRLAQSDLGLLRRVQRMLARLGVLATLYGERRPSGTSLLPDGRGGAREYRVKAQHELVIAAGNLHVFARRVGFGDEAKRERLTRALAAYRRAPNRERFVDAIVAITPDGEEEVFDVTVERVHEFDANGLRAHNCGEIPLYPGEPCDLGAMNLAAYVREPGQGLAGFDDARFRADVGTCIRFLDNVLDVNRFALSDNREMSMKLRRLGLGVMGLADALIRMGFAYNSDEGRAAVNGMIASLRDAATAASEALGKERGTFPLLGESTLDEPRRNVAVLTVAPTGTTSMVMGVSSGVEPVFAPSIYRKIGSDYVALVHPLFRELMAEHAPHPDYADGDDWDWDKVVTAVQDNHGSVQGLAFVPDAVRAVLVCAHDISPSDHVRMQGVVQRAFDGSKMVANSISKTINLPKHASSQDVFDAYALAFQTGCKGITVYRDGSREFQVLSTTASKPAADAGPGAPAPAGASVGVDVPAPPAVAAAAMRDARADRLPSEPLFERPLRLSGFTDAVKLMLPSGEKRGFFVTVNKQDGLPTEVFIVSGKAGDEANADSEALGRVVSIALQYGVPAEAVIKTLRGINGGMYGTYHGRLVASKADLLAVALETAGAENVLNRGKSCPDCGAPLRFEEGCQKCENCGYSKCG